MMNTIHAGKRALAVCLLLLLAVGCSREQQDWRSAEVADTIEAYTRFIQRHPESELTTEARTRIAQLGEERDWARAGSADTADAYKEFLAQHPNGPRAQEARIRIDNFSLGAQAPGAHSPDEPREPAAPQVLGASQVPGTSQVPEAAQVSPGAAGNDAGSFGVQLGAFSSQSAADSQWQALSGRFGSELQGLSEHIVQADTPSGRIYRLQAAVGNETRARAICDSFRRQAQACVPVVPR